VGSVDTGEYGTNLSCSQARQKPPHEKEREREQGFSDGETFPVCTSRGTLHRPLASLRQQVRQLGDVGGDPLWLRRGWSKSAADLAVPSLCVVLDVGAWSAPCVMAALAGVVHNRQGAANPKHDRRENNQQRGFHRDLATAGPPNLPQSFELSWFK
jgi:hypothetical protein